VVVTANHYWLDGVAAAALVGLAALVQRFMPGAGRPCDHDAHDDRDLVPVGVSS
jgi:hypothetical protein